MPLAPPEQVKSIDPFSENRFSTVVNRFTRIYTGGKDVLLFPGESFLFADSVSEDSTSNTTVNFSTGYAVKDDVIIHISEQAGVDFSDDDYYLDEVPGMVNAGWYYILLWYNYQRTYPPASVYYRILRDTALFPIYKTNYLFLAAVYVGPSSILDYAILTEEDEYYLTEDGDFLVLENYSEGGSNIVLARSYYDPTSPTVGKREYLEVDWIG